MEINEDDIRQYQEALEALEQLLGPDYAEALPEREPTLLIGPLQP